MKINATVIIFIDEMGNMDHMVTANHEIIAAWDECAPDSDCVELYRETIELDIEFEPSMHPRTTRHQITYPN